MKVSQYIIGNKYVNCATLIKFQYQTDKKKKNYNMMDM